MIPLEMYVENVRGIQTARIKFPPSGIVQINGGNETGKTTLLKAFAWPLVGKPGRPDWETVKREGKHKGTVTLIVGEPGVPEYEVELIFRKGDELLTVKRCDGRRLDTPQQSLLNTWWNKCTLQPEVFKDLTVSEQRELVIKAFPPPVTEEYAELVGRMPNDGEDPIALLDETIKQLYAVDRRDINRDLKAEEMKLVEFKDVPDNVEPVDVTSEQKRQSELQSAVAAIERFEYQYDMKQSELERITNRIAELQREAEELNATIETMILERPDGDVGVMRHELQACSDRIAAAGLYQQSKRKRQIEANVAAFTQQSAALTERLERLRDHKKWIVQESKLPEPLGFDEEYGLTFHGETMEQRGDSRAILVGYDVGMALRPELRAVLVNRGGEIDHEIMDELSAKANADGVIVLMVRQEAYNPDQVNFIIEDGVVKEVEQ